MITLVLVFFSIPPKSTKYEKSSFSLQGLKFRKRLPVRCNSVCKMVGCQIQHWQLHRCWVPPMRPEWPDYIAVDPGLQKRKTTTNGFRLTLGSRQQLHGLTPRADKMANSGWRNTHLDTAMMGLTLRSINPKDTRRFVVPIELFIIPSLIFVANSLPGCSVMRAVRWNNKYCVLRPQNVTRAKLVKIQVFISRIDEKVRIL